MTVTAPGQVEWAGQVIHGGPGAWDLWMPFDLDFDGWDVEYDHGDQPTEVGAAPGKPIVRAMYPSLVGVVCEDAEAYNTLAASMDPVGATLADLVWWDQPTDTIWVAQALPRECIPSRAQGAQLAAHRRASLRWFIPRPGDITEGS